MSHLRLTFRPLPLLILLWSPLTDAEEIRFESHVRPIFKKHCWQCHGEEEEVQGGLDLRLVRFMKVGGDSGAAIAEGPEDSLLFERLRDGEMPPDDTAGLTPEELLTVRQWIEQGAATLRPEPEEVTEVAFISDEERSHWSFQPIQRPPLPATDQPVNPVDAFVRQRLAGAANMHPIVEERAAFMMSTAASPAALARRLYLGLHGLPPTPEQLHAFLSAADVGTIVDELLASPRYGEYWAQHWLDTAGYADSEGYNDADSIRSDAWRYRDYVIRCFNEDRAFDRFIMEQLAGDELVTSPMDNLSAKDAELLTATGFLRMAPDGTGGAVPDAMVARNDTIADTLRIVSSSLMGLTVGCAQCHDHRYDPVSQADYYRFRAIFDPAFDWQNWRSPPKRRVSLYTDSERSKAAEIESKAVAIEKERTAKQAEYIKATFEKQLAKLPQSIHEQARAAHGTAAAKRTPAQKALFQKHPSLNVTAGSLYLYDRKASDQLAEMAEQAKKIRASKPKENYVRALTESGRLPKTHLFFRGNHDQPRQELSPAGLTVVSLVTGDLPQIPINDERLKSSGRRLALARRLTSPDYPLTARVIVNRIWMHHFGRGLVRTPADFGILGTAPSHPLLLDWLAAEFIESGWSVKHIHRLILTSRTWQQQVRDSDLLDRLDPENELYAGAMLQRMEAEVVRDSMLLISGKLNLKAGGPPVPVMADRVGRFVIGQENLNAGRPGKKIEMNGEEFRRSIFIQARRSRPLSVLATFDRPAMSPNCDRRRPSTASTQSLMMMNSNLLVDYSRFLADRVSDEHKGDLSAQVHRAWQLVYCRAPEESETQLALQFLNDQAELFAAQPQYRPDAKNPPKRSAEVESLSVLCQMLFSSNEFLYID